jgi:hypothetical protein
MRLPRATGMPRFIQVLTASLNRTAAVEEQSQEPRPMQEEIDSGEAKQMDGTLANTRHLGSLRYSGGG